MAKLVPMRRYRVQLPGWRAAKVMTYTGYTPGDDRVCDVCRKEGRGAHEFLGGDPETSPDGYYLGTACLRKCKITPEAAKEDQMGTMRDVFGRIEEATFRGMGAITNTSANARAAKDAERAAKSKAEYAWRKDPKRDVGGSETLYNAYQDAVAWVSWEDEDDVAPYDVRVANPDGGCGAVKKIGSGFPSLAKAKAAAERELGL